MTRIISYLGTRQRKLSLYAPILITLNALDALLSVWTTRGGLDEYSPLWGPVLEASPALFVMTKVGAISALVVFLARRREFVARAGVVVCTVMYALLIAYHVYVLAGGMPVDLWDYRLADR